LSPEVFESFDVVDFDGVGVKPLSSMCYFREPFDTCNRQRCYALSLFLTLRNSFRSSTRCWLILRILVKSFWVGLVSFPVCSHCLSSSLSWSVNMYSLTCMPPCGASITVMRIESKMNWAS